MLREFGQKYSEGHDVEEGVLGKVEPGFRESFEEYWEKKEIDMLEYYTFEQAVDTVKKYQPFKNPAKPLEKNFPPDLLDTINQSLKLERGSGQLKYYTFVGSRLDNMGLDAMIELLTMEEKRLRVALDITISEQRLEEKRNNMVEELYKEIKQPGRQRLLIPYVPFLWPADGLNLKDIEDETIFNQITRSVSSEVINRFDIEAEKQGLTISSLDAKEVQRSEKMARKKWERRSLRLPRIPLRRMHV